MQYNETKLIVFLQSLSVSELNEFEKFINSPFFNQIRDPLPLYKILKRFHPEFTSEKLSEENIFAEIYPDLNFSDKKSKDLFRTVSSALLKAVEEFIYFSKIKGDKVLKNKIFLKELLNRNLTKYYKQYLQAASNDLELKNSAIEEDILEEFHLEKLNIRYYSYILDFENMFKNSEKSAESISTYFLIDLFRTAKSKFLGSFGRNIDSENSTLSNLLKSLNLEMVLNNFENTPYNFKLYFNYYTYKCLFDENGFELFEKAKNLFFEKKSTLNRYDKCSYYADLLNISIIKNNLKLPEFKNEIFPIIKSCVEDRSYKISESDFMQLDFYRNAVLYANVNKEYLWIEEFEKSHSRELIPEFRDNMRYYTLALFNYGLGNYEISLENISKLKFDLKHFKIDVKILMLKIYHKLNLPEQVHSLIDTFKHYLINAKDLPPPVKARYNNFLNYYLLITRNKNIKDENEKEIIRKQLKNEKNVYLINWLNELIEEM